MRDYNNYRDNTNLLLLLNSVVKSLVTSSVNSTVPLAVKVLLDEGLISYSTSQLKAENYRQSIAQRRSIYPYIHNLTSFLDEYLEQPEAQELKKEIENRVLEDWNYNKQSYLQTEKVFEIEWGQMDDFHEANSKREPRKEDYKVVRHEQGESKGQINLLTDKGAASSTKTIIKRSIDARLKMAGLDSEIKAIL